MKTRDEFINRWKSHTAGIIALGSARVRRIVTAPLESASAFGEVICNLEEQTKILLGQLYDDLAAKPEPTKTVPVTAPAAPASQPPVANGNHQRKDRQ